MKRYGCMLLVLMSASAQAKIEDFHGEFINISLGMNGSSVRGNAYSNVSIIGDSNTYAYDAFKAAATNCVPAVGIGFIWIFHPRFTLGGQLTYNNENTGITQTLYSYEVNSGLRQSITLNFKLKNSFSALLKPGILMNPGAFLYGVLGVAWGNVKMSTACTYQQQLGGGFMQGSNARDPQHLHRWGATLGVGVQQLLGERWSIGLEYLFTYFDDVKILDNRATVTNAGTPSGTFITEYTKIRMQTQRTMLSLYYRT